MYVPMKDIWALIPAYNAGTTIGHVIRECRGFIDNILVVDDGSIDDTHAIAGRSGCATLKHGHNRGKGAALKTGFQWLLRTDCAAVITIDADGQHDPSEIPNFERFFNAEEGEVIIIGSRSAEGDRMPLYRAIPNKIGEALISLAARRYIRDTQSGYRLYSRGVLEKNHCATDRFDMETEIIIKASRNGAKIKEIPIKTIYQENYTSHFRPVMDFYRISMVVLKHFI